MTLQEILEDYERQDNPSRFGITSLSQAASPMSFQFEDAVNPYSAEMMAAKQLMTRPYGISGIGQQYQDPAFFGNTLFTGTTYQPYSAKQEEFQSMRSGIRPGFLYDKPTSLDFDTSYGVANEEDEEQVEYLPGQEPKGIEKLFNFLRNIPTPMNIIRGGIDSLRGFNDRIRNTDFGRSRTLAEYFQKRRERKQAERAREANRSVYESADRQGFTNDRGGFSTDRADDRGTSEGSGQFSPSSSRGRSGY